MQRSRLKFKQNHFEVVGLQAAQIMNLPAKPIFSKFARVGGSWRDDKERRVACTPSGMYAEWHVRRVHDEEPMMKNAEWHVRRVAKYLIFRKIKPMFNTVVWE